MTSAATLSPYDRAIAARIPAPDVLEPYRRARASEDMWSWVERALETAPVITRRLHQPPPLPGDALADHLDTYVWRRAAPWSRTMRPPMSGYLARTQLTDLRRDLELLGAPDYPSARRLFHLDREDA